MNKYDTYIAIGPHAWGKSHDIHEALQNAYEEGAEEFVVYLCTKDATCLHTNGNIQYPGPDEEPIRLARFMRAGSNFVLLK